MMKLRILLAIAVNAIHIVSTTGTVSSSSNSNSSSQTTYSSESHNYSSAQAFAQASASSYVSGESGTVSSTSGSAAASSASSNQSGSTASAQASAFSEVSDSGAVDSSSSSAESDSSSIESSDSSDSQRYARSNDGDTSSSCELESDNGSINASCGGDENAVPGCGINCGRLCSNYNRTDVACILLCKENGCDCKEDFVFDEQIQRCVRPEQCTTKICNKPNEVYDICPAPCPPRRCDVNEALILCAVAPKPGDPECEPGCRCADGYVRNSAGICIPKEECPTCSNPNEVYDECPAPCPPRRCDVDESTIRCAAPPKVGDPACKPGCRCADGFYRNSEGICVTKNECNNDQCGPNEEFACPSFLCRPENCSQLGYPVECPTTIDQECPVESRCVCKQGYLRDYSGVCVLSSECPSCGGDPHAVAGCGINCGRLCSNYFRNDTACIALCYENACDCRKGYVYDSNTRKCVLPDKCTPVCKENEVYSTCINGGCDAKNCSQLGQPKICVDPLTCIHGCICKEGYLRAANGTCVPKEQCPITCGGDPNAQPGCGINCGRLCSNYNKGPVSCITLCKSNACDCKPGYVLDENTKRCVLPKQCTPTCGQYEVYSNCINGGCQAKNCSQLGKDVPCIKLAPESCIKGCLCQEGYLRNKNGICVPENECPESCTGLNEVYDSCPPICPPQTCNSINKTYHCPLIKTDPKNCKGACRCKSGYYRNSINQCISKDDCLKCTGPNEYFSCGGACDNVCSTLSTQNQTNCPIVNIVCNRQCYCEEGYARDDNNTCIPIDQCKVSCGGDPNAEPGCGLNCNKRCSTLTTKGICPRIQCPPHGCECKSGFVYDDNVKKCVSPNECTPTCGDNEVYSACINGGCQAKNCTQIGIPLSCPRIPEENCIKGCLCAEGFLRANNGTCIPKNQCPVTCGGDPNAEPGCGLHCNNRCSTLKIKGICPRIQCPRNGCECKPGYVFDDNTKRCVTPKNCTPQCGAYEKFVECLSSITIQNCSQLGFPTTFSDNSKSCTGGSGCVCEDGYLRNNKGVCVPQKECPSCGGDPNAQSGCGGYCGRRCSTLKNKGPTVCPAICRLNACDCKTGYVFDDNLGKCVLPEECTPTCKSNEVYSDCTNGGCQAKNCTQLGKPIRCAKIAQDKCKKGCLCKDGYLRAVNGTCVLKEQCPVTCVGQNEVYDACPPTCPPQTCESIYSRYACPEIPVNRTCNGSCRCKPGFYRNKINQCISQDDCLKCTGPNEFFSCGGACDNVCSTLNEQNQTNCSIVNIVCNRMCYCQKGYARDENNICVPIDQCKVSCGGDPNAEPGCGQNCGRRCSNYNKGPVACALVCNENGCDCKHGYVYDDNINACVLPSKCSPVCRKNEVYSSCIQGHCKAQNCSQLGQSIPCPRIDPSKCIQGCLCQEGYLRGSNGTCIPENECPLKCTGPHEFFSCGSECDNECATINTQNRTNCPIVNIQCNRKCYCKDGYARDENNICIPINQCKVCGDNERLEKCPSNLCGPQNCSQVGYPLTCEASDDSETCPVAPACVCIDGYVRNKKGKCIPKEQCPSCGGDPNAVSGCGVNCNKHCSDLNGKPKACIRICYPNACDCKDGYYYDDNTKKCVKQEYCSPVCRKNEVYSSCIQGNCKAETCSQLGQSIPCPRIDPRKCIQGCLCQEGYLRGSNGTCIPENECPLKCTGPHEFFSCGSECDNECATINTQNRTNCPIVNKKCNRKCYCKDGYARDENNVCIPIHQCKVCGDNERLEKCPSNLCGPQNCSQVGYPLTCEASNDSETCPVAPACVCIDGYVRNKKGKCIPKEQCPSCGGDPNAVSGCGVNCNKHCSDLNGKPKACIRICYPNACDCKDGYYYDDNTKKCVKQEYCSPQCGQNEKYVKCPLCQPQTCLQLGFPLNCTSDSESCFGEPGCICKDGYLRNSKGICIPEQECPSCGGDPNAVAGCGVNCNRHCADIGKEPGGCIAVCIKNSCDCRYGYYYDDYLKKCVKAEDCTPKCGVNEKYEECTSNSCEPQDCSQVGFPLNCTGSDTCSGKPGCVCLTGYVRDSYGRCILASDCPSCGGDPNAVAGCGVNCNKHCSNLGKESGFCILACFTNACDCKEGYYYDDNLMKCVLPENCTPTCGPDEVYSACINDGCFINECSQLGKPTICLNSVECVQGCLCKNGFLRADNGTCVPEHQCQLQCTKPHEVFDSCPSNCPPQICESLTERFPCPLRPADRKYCQPACRCEPGYYRNKIGDCISEEDCLKCTGPNEYFSCGGACDNVCATLKVQNQTNCPIINIVCNKMCYCDEGYARDDNNICIPIDECKAPQCGENEIYENCPSCSCQPRTCSDVGYPVKCPSSACSRQPDTPACVCVEGYVRNDKGKCIPMSDCPSCGGDPNAVSGCGVNCNRHCYNLNKEPGFCTALCKKNSCDCKPGYYYDDNIKQCVRPKQCTKTCKENEVYTTCANGGCDMRNCSQVGQPMICIHPYKCTDGCVCVEGYLRDDNGVCVPENQCQGPTSTSPTPIEGPSTEITTTESSDIPISDEETARAAILFTKGDVNFSNRFLYQLLQANPDKSFISSGFSILFVLGQLGLFSQNLAQLQINNATGLSTLNEYVAAYKGVIKNIREQRSVTLELANKIYANELVPLSNNFIDTTRNVFDAEAQNTDFSQSREAAATINDWVANKTHGKIEDLVDESMFDASTRLVLVNALYFQSNWSTQFNPSNTKDRDFYVNGNVIKKLPTMYMKSNSMPYGENEELDCQILQMPYQSKNFSCGFILPRNQTTVLSVAEKLYKNPDLWSSALGSLRREAVNIYIPKMELRTDIDLSSIFEQLGLGALLDPSQNSFTGILKKDEPLYVSKAVQQAYVKIEESGTEAAAATGIAITTFSVRAQSPYYTFDANRPFIFFIKFGSIILFSGFYTG